VDLHEKRHLTWTAQAKVKEQVTKAKAHARHPWRARSRRSLAVIAGCGSQPGEQGFKEQN